MGIDKYWHDSIEQITKILDCSQEGLSTEEAAKRLSKFGLNSLVGKKKLTGFLYSC